MKIFVSIILSVVYSCSFVPSVRSARYSDDGYNGAVESYYITEQISYSSKADDEVVISQGMPKYYDVSGKTNACSVISGATVLGFYDINFESLIPDFNPLRIIMGKYLYSAQNDKVQAVIDTLYTNMGTNVGGVGTTFNGFKQGLSKYLSEKGRNISYSDTVSWGNFNYNNAKNFISQSVPLVCFIAGFNLIDIQTFEELPNMDKYLVSFYSGSHTSVVYGVRSIKYYNANGQLIRADNFLKVATGYATLPFAYMRIESSLGLDHVISVKIT